MSDFTVQFIEGIIPASDLDVDVVVSTTDFNKAFLIPAIAPQQTAGIGRSDGTQEDSFASSLATANLIDADTLRFIRHTLPFINDLVGIHLVEYTGPAGGVNEVIVRAVKVFGGTAAVIESTAIAGIVDINKCVAFVTMGGSLNSGAATSHLGKAEVVNNGVDDVVRVTKTNATNNLDVVAYVVEFVGSNWTVQKVSHTFAAADTDENDVIASVGDVANAFIYTTFKAGNNLPHQCTYYAWLSSATQLRQRIRGTLTGGPQTISYVISNPQLSVQVIGPDPDGTADLLAVGSAPETVNLAVATIPNINQAIVLGYAGSFETAAANRPGILRLFNLTTSTNLQVRRSISVGDTEYKIQLIDFTDVVGLSIDNVTQLIDGANFTITGNFGTLTGDGVTLGGVVQAAVSANTTEIVRTSTLGTLKYGPHDLVVTAGGTLTAPGTFINPPATKNFVDLGALATSGQRITATPDLAPGDQLEWSNVVGGTIVDVTVGTDATFSCTPGVTAFTVRVNDGTGWGLTAVQDVTAQAGDTLNTIVKILTDFIRLISFSHTNIEHDT